MPPLKNSRYEAYAQGIASGKTADQAYTDAGYTPNPKNATRLKKNEEVLSRIAELQEQIAKDREDALRTITKTEVLCRQWVIETLMRNVKICMGEMNKLDGHEAAGANRALELLGKELGMFVDRTENINTSFVISGSPDDDNDADPEQWVAQNKPH